MAWEGCSSLAWYRRQMLPAVLLCYLAAQAHGSSHTCTLLRQVALRNVSFAVSLRQDGSETHLKVQAGEDPVNVVSHFAAEKKLAPIRARYLSMRLQNCVSRQHRPVHTTLPITLPGNGAGARVVPLTVHEGDDLWLVAMLFGAEYNIDADGTHELAAALTSRIPQHASAAWRAQRVDRQACPGCPHADVHTSVESSVDDVLQPDSDAMLDLWSKSQHHSAHHVKDAKERKSGRGATTASGCVHIVITTCKRLKLFMRTASALVSALGTDFGTYSGTAANATHSLVCKITVIDDNSSLDDRITMARAFPTFSFVYKSSSEAGHARSMNIALALTRGSGGRFLLYLEDDWLVQNGTGEGNTHGSNLLSKRLRDALELLSAANNGAVTKDTVMEQNLNLRLPRLAQVLLNDQGGGWRSTLPPPSMTEFRLHEFGTADPSHQLAWWPGFSLNPALWDVRELWRSAQRRCCCASSDKQALRIHFSEKDRTFEQNFALAVHDAGLRVAFLPALGNGTTRLNGMVVPSPLFAHIGTASASESQSAYQLNNFSRPWDKSPDTGEAKTEYNRRQSSFAKCARRKARRLATREARNRAIPSKPLPLFAFEVALNTSGLRDGGVSSRLRAHDSGAQNSSDTQSSMVLSIRPDQDALMMAQFFCGENHIGPAECAQVAQQLQQLRLLHDTQDALLSVSFADAFCVAAGIRQAACAEATSVADLFRRLHMHWSLADTSSEGQSDATNELESQSGGNFKDSAHFFKFYGLMQKLAAKSRHATEHLEHFRSSPFYHFLTTVGAGCRTAACLAAPWREALELAHSVNAPLLQKLVAHARIDVGSLRVMRVVPRSKGDGSWAHLDALGSQHAMLLTLLFDAIQRESLQSMHANMSFVEIGGGWGNMARIVHKTFGVQRWTVIDVAEVSRLQAWYFDRTLGANGTVHVARSAMQLPRHARGTALFNCVDVARRNEWAASELGRASADVLIATHSWSELAIDDFYWYVNMVLPKVRYILYATQLGNEVEGGKSSITAQYVQHKLDVIGRTMDRVAEHKSENGAVLNIVFRKREQVT